MASKSLGTLTIDLIAKVGGFTAGMDKAERATQKWRKQAEADFKAVTVGLTAVSAAAVAAGAAGFALLKSTADQVNTTDQWAKSLKMSTQELLAWQFAAEKAGLSGDNMADIFKDLGDKIGDAVLNKSGEAVDALNALGLSADKLSKVSPDKQMLAIGDALGKISTNAGKVTILESLGNDLSKLLPLFDNNNEKLKQFIQLAKDYGVAPDPQSIDDLVKVNDLFQDMEAQVKGLKMEIAAGLAKVDLTPLQHSLDQIHTVLTDPAVLKGIVDLVSDVAELAGWIITIAAKAGEIASLTNNRAAAVGGNIDTTNLDQVTERIEYLQKTMSNRSENGSWFGNLFGVDDSTEKAQKELEQLIKLRDDLQNKPTLPTASATVAPESGFALTPGQQNGKTTPDAGAKKLESAFKATERSYMRQIELIDTTGKKTTVVTEQQKLQFDIADGKLQGLNETQKKRLEYLAQEVDRLNEVKKANQENAKVAAFVANLQAQNSNAQSSFDIDEQGAGLGDKERERLKERLNIERDYLDQQRDLQAQYQSGDITKSVYDRETQALKDAQSDRIKALKDHYKKMDELQADWVAGAKNGFANWADEISDVSGTVSDGVKSSLDGVFSNVTSMLEGNKVSWKSWGISVLQIIEKVALQMAVVSAMGGGSSSSGILGTVASGIAGYFGGGASAATSSSNAFSSGAYSNLSLNAKGGVYASHDLSQHSNSIVSSPTLFAFAKGAGLMGEAGPEAIMPLTRAADGSLGVRALGGGNSAVSGGAPQVYISIDSNGNTSTQSTDGWQQFGSEIGNFVDQRYKQNMMRDIRPGGDIWNAMKSR
ncbi:phage tail tape measure protein [Mixta mediterraneensis]|uniref:phage tail tape measure protein n=1 Tax=Mixta mediterraneensis TaxID=2758443 RepID=UPI001877037A|nr:phage tail tape measure protein [Mixta mediterraneensis]MBE5251724.1 phage tail tape measure protein [Mixta mediterraneensis]